MHIDHLDKQADLSAITSEWMALWQRVPDATPFQSPLWLLAWWHRFGTAMPRIVIARGEQDLVGVLPLYELREAGCIKLLPLGVSVSDYIDALVDPAYPKAAGALLAAAADIPGWHEYHLPDLPPDAGLRRAAAPPGVVESRDPGSSCPVLMLPESSNDLASVVPRKTLRDVRQALTRSAAIGPVRIETADLSTFEAALEDLFQLHARRWRERGEPGVLESPAVREFHREAARSFCKTGMLRLHRLWIGGSVVGVYYGFHCNRKAYAYLGGFDPEMTRLSPGAQLLQHAICAAIREGACEFHFLRGGENYKYAWGAIDRFNQIRTFRRA